MRERARILVESHHFRASIMILILLNSLTLAIETFPMTIEAQLGMSMFNLVCISIFVIEIALKIYVYGTGFFSDGWNLFDFIIVMLSLLPEIAFLSTARLFRIFRIFRAFRATRLINHTQKLRKIVTVMLDSLPGLGWTIGVLGILYYIYAIIGTSLYKDISPQYFGNLWRSTYTLFQITMADDLGAVTRPIIQEHSSAVLYFISFIVIAVLLILNIIIGIIVDNVEEANKNENKARMMATADSLEEELRKLDEQYRKVRVLLVKEIEENKAQTRR